MAHDTVSPLAYDFFLESNPQFGATPGQGNLYVCEIDTFLTFADLPVSGTNQGDLRKIITDHTFAAGKGFRSITLYRGDSQTDGDAPGDPGFKSNKYQVKGFIVGVNAEVREFCEFLKNKGVIVLQDAPDPADSTLYQFGTQDCPCVVSGFKQTTGSRINGGKKGYEITFEAMDWYDYQGTITFQSE